MDDKATQTRIIKNACAALQRQVKEGRLAAADKSWALVHDLYEVSPETQGAVSKKRNYEANERRKRLWECAAKAPRCADTLDWLCAKSPLFLMSPADALRKIKTILNGLNTISNLEVASWLVARTPIETKSLQGQLKDLIHHACSRHNAQGLEWIFHLGLNMDREVHATKNPMLMRAMGDDLLNQKGTSERVAYLISQGVKPIASDDPATRHPEAGSWPLSLLAIDYQRDHEIRSRLAPAVERSALRIWEALVKAGDTPDRAEEGGVTPRQKIAGLPLDAALRAQERQAKTLDEADVLLPKRPRLRV